MDNICMHVVVKYYVRISLRFACFVLAASFSFIQSTGCSPLLLLLAYAKTKTAQYYNIFPVLLFILRLLVYVLTNSLNNKVNP